MKKDYRNQFFLGLTGVFYLYAIMKAATVPMHIPVNGWQLFLFALAAILFYFLVNTRPGRIVFYCTVGLGIGFAAYLLLRDGTANLQQTFGSVISLGQVMYQVGTGYYNETISTGSLMLSVGLFSLVVAIPVYYSLVPRFRFYWLITPGFVLFMCLWGMFRHVDKMSFYVFITVAIVCFIYHKYILHREKASVRKGIPSDTSALVYFIPVALVVLLITATFSFSELPIQWPWLDEKINDWYWDISMKFDIDRYDHFSLANTGFGDPSKLGGPVRPDYTPVMVVKAPARVYLRGAVYDQYTGLGWEASDKSGQDYLSDRTLDHRELRYGWKATAIDMEIWGVETIEQILKNGPTLPEHSRDGFAEEEGNAAFSVGSDETTSLRKLETITPDQYLDFVREDHMPGLLSTIHPQKELTIRHLNVRTKSLFTPLKLYQPILGLRDEKYIIKESFDGIFQADRRLAGDSQYKYDYIQPAYGMKVMENYFNMSKPGIYRRFNENNQKFFEQLEQSDITNVGTMQIDLKNLLQVYRDLERHRNEVYQLYTQIPEETPQRVLDFAMMLTQDHSTTYSKVKALEEYLQNNYTYTLTPQTPPEDQDFVDYFLFEGKEGYCSYYASALCILTRALGIPARYVEGFAMPEKPDENGYYHVTNQNAHAWTEVYLEGVGWVTFEPTSTFAGAMNYLVSLTESSGEGNYERIPMEFEEPSSQLSYNPNINIDLQNDEGREVTTVTIFICFVVAILFVMLLNLLFVLIRRLILNMMSPQKSVIWLYRHLVTLLCQAGCEVRLGETPKDYAKRVDERFQFTHMTMAEMVDVFYSVRFGAHAPDKNKQKKIFDFAGEARIKTGRTMYFFRRILLRGLLFRG